MFSLPLLCSQCGSFHHICSLIITRRATIYVNNAPFKRQAEFIFNHLYVFKKRKYVLHHLITFIPAKDWTLEAARSSGRVQLYCCVSVNATTLGQFSASFLRPDRRQVQKYSIVLSPFCSSESHTPVCCSAEVEMKTHEVLLDIVISCLSELFRLSHTQKSRFLHRRAE